MWSHSGNENCVKFSTTKKGHKEIFRGDRHVNYLIVVMASYVCAYV